MSNKFFQGFLSFLVIQSIQIPINHFYKRKRIPNGQSKKDTPEKLAALGTQDDEKQNKNKTICSTLSLPRLFADLTIYMSNTAGVL
jgi:hypothetical protein